MNNIIKFIAQEIAQENGFLLINSKVKGSSRNPKFEIFIDDSKGINAEDCAKFSKELKNRLESTEIAELNYELEVSSPGIDEPIKFFEQYPKHIGREFKVSFEENENKVLSIEAKLLRIEDQNLIFYYNNQEIQINFNKIKKAKVKLSF